MTTDFDTLFPDVRESGETPVRQCQLVILRMLKIFDYLCEKHGIKYFLVGGTLLGAIRHQGFIPWDDDLDLGMTRDDYEKFVKYAAPELPYDIFFQNLQTDKYYPAFHMVDARLRDKYSRNFRKPELEKQYKWHNGIQLDIFIYDRAFLPHNRLIYYMNMMFIKYFKADPAKDVRGEVLRRIEKYSPFPLVYASSFICRHRLMRLGANYIRKNEIAKLVKVKFEDMEAYIPNGWEACLKRQYGDYMKLPPVEKRKGSHSIGAPDPYTPCNHSEILYWSERKKAKSNVVAAPETTENA